MDLFQNSTSKPNNSADTNIGNHQEPLATRMRPNSLKDFAGQKHLVGEGNMLYRMIEKRRDRINDILWAAKLGKNYIGTCNIQRN